MPNTVPPSGNWTIADLSDLSALAAALVDQEIVFHLAGASLPEVSNRDPAEDVRASVLPTLQLFDLCRGAQVRKVVFASSGGTVYGVPSEVPTPESSSKVPVSAYGINKLMVENYLELYRHLFGLDYHVLRIANPYGPGQSPLRRQGIVAVMLHRALSGQNVEIWGTGDVIRDFIHVDDVSSAFIAGAMYHGPRRIMNVGSAHGRSLKQVADDITTTLGQSGMRVMHLPGRAADVPVSILDNTLIRKETGWTPKVDWLSGLRDTARWISVEHPATTRA